MIANMLAVLESPENRRTIYPVSVDFYHEAARCGLLGDDVELLEGVLFKKMPKSPLHETVVRRLLHHLRMGLPEGFSLGQGSPLTCKHSEPEPDLAVFPGEWSDYRHHHPSTAELVIEVAINTRERDRSKAGIYAEAGVEEYWLIEPESRTVTRYTQPAVTGYAQVDTAMDTGVLESTLFTSFQVDLATLFA